MLRILTFITALLALSSCKIFKSNLMLKTPRNYNYDKLVDSLSRTDYRIAPNDVLVFKVFPNEGFKMIDLANTTLTTRTDIDVIVESDGQVKMPLIGRVNVAGLTIIEAEKLMEEKYTKYYVDPFVTLKVNNKRVMVFPGNSGVAKVVTLLNNNTSVLEAIASAGGIPEDGKAYKAKLIRRNPDPNKQPYVFLMDLSRIEGIAMGNTIVQANDIIYVEPRYRPLRTFTNEISPVITLVTTFFILFQISKLINP